MRRAQKLLVLVLLAAALVVVGSSRGKAIAQVNYGSAKLQWGVTPIITLSLTPNYQSGFGPQGGSGSGSTPAPGSGATLGGGTIDFGNQVVQGFQYIYKYAVQASVVTNDGLGFKLFAEGASDINDTTNSSTVPINQILYWLVSSTSNNPFTNATPFEKTASPTSSGCAAVVAVGGQCINYAGSPPGTAVIWSYPTATVGQPGNTAKQGYDYQLHLGSVQNADTFNVFITYTAVGN